MPGPPRRDMNCLSTPTSCAIDGEDSSISFLPIRSLYHPDLQRPEICQPVFRIIGRNLGSLSSRVGALKHSGIAIGVIIDEQRNTLRCAILYGRVQISQLGAVKLL